MYLEEGGEKVDFLVRLQYVMLVIQRCILKKKKTGLSLPTVIVLCYMHLDPGLPWTTSENTLVCMQIGLILPKAYVH